MAIGAGTAVDILFRAKANFGELDKAFDKAGKDAKGFEGGLAGLGKSMSATGGIMTAALTGPIIAMGAFAMESASTVGGAFKTIAKQTGETGKTLDLLKQQFRDVFASVPNDAQTVAEVISKVHSTMDITQDKAAQLSTQFLNLANVTGVNATDAADKLTGAFNVFQLSADESRAALDDLLTVSQETGTDMNVLIQDVATAAPTFNAMKMSIQDTMIIMGQLERAGVNSGTAMRGLNKVFTDASKAGKEPLQMWNELTKAIKENNKESDAYKQAAKELGPRAFAQLSNAIKQGALDTTELTRALQGNEDQINKTAVANRTFSQNLEIFKHRLEVAFQPLGSVIFNILNTLLDRSTPILNLLTRLATGFSNLSPTIQIAVVAIGALAAAAGPALLVAGQMLTAWSKIGPAVSGASKGLTGILGITGKAAPKDPFASLLQTADCEKKGSKCGASLVSGIQSTASAQSKGGLLSKIPLLGGLGGAGGAGGGGGIASALGLGGLSSLLLPVIAIVGALAAAFAVLYATSATFRSMVGGIVDTFKELFAWGQKFVGVLLSGNFGEAGKMLSEGFGHAIDVIKTFDYGEWVRKMILSIKESLMTIGNFIGPALENGLKAFDKWLDDLSKIDWGKAVQGFIDAIMGLFGGGGAKGGGGGKGGGKGGSATATVSTGMNDALIKGVTEAGPRILTSLGQVFLKLVTVLPSVFAQIALALWNAFIHIDWGGVGNTIMTRIKSVDWGAIGRALLAAFLVLGWVTVGQRIMGWISSVDWGSIPSKLVNFFTTQNWGGHRSRYS